MNVQKLTIACFALLLCHKADAQLTSAAPYCEPAFGNQYNMFNTMKVQGTSFSFGPLGKWSKKDPFYYYNTTVFPDLEKGKAASIEITPHLVEDGEPIYFAVWIDYNQDNTFDNTELVMQNSNTIKARLPWKGETAKPILLNITVPTTAKTGKTRMRVMRGQSVPPADYMATFSLQPCPVAPDFTNTYGCTYDFNVNIKGAPSAINERVTEDRVLFMPNPAQEGKIQIAENFAGAALRIADLSGKLILQQETISNTTIDVSSFQPGMYFLSLIKDGQTYTQALQVNR